MIQRIQTLWLAFAVLLSGAMFFFPLAMYDIPWKEFNVRCTYFLLAEGGSGAGLTQSSIAISSLITNCLVGVITLVTIFLFKNRTLQRKVLAFAFLIALVEIALNYFYQINAGLTAYVKGLTGSNTALFNEIINNSATKSTWGFGMFFPIVQLVCFVFALKGIKKDEAIVRGADRLR